MARGRPEDLDRALHMLEQAEETAVRLGGCLSPAKSLSVAPLSPRG